MYDYSANVMKAIKYLISEIADQITEPYLDNTEQAIVLTDLKNEIKRRLTSLPPDGPAGGIVDNESHAGGAG